MEIQNFWYSETAKAKYHMDHKVRIGLYMDTGPCQIDSNNWACQGQPHEPRRTKKM